MEPTGTGTEWLRLVGQILGIAGGIAGLVAFFLRYANPADKIESWTGEDWEYRSELAKELKGRRPGSLYRNTLEGGLDWLDRKFGLANSAKALGACIIIALYYSYAAFFLVWGIGGPGDIAGVSLLSESVEWSRRLLGALMLATMLPIAFLFGRWLAGLERRLRLRLGWRRRYSRFELIYRGAWAVPLGLALSLSSITADETEAFVFFSVILALGPAAGAMAAKLCRPHVCDTGAPQLRRMLVASAAGAMATIVAILALVASPIDIGGRPSVSALYVCTAFAYALLVSIALPAPGTIFGSLIFVAMALFAVVTVIPTLGIGIGLAAGMAWAAGAAAGALALGRQIAAPFSGAIGGLVGVGFGVLFVGPELPGGAFLVATLLFFLVLPVVNGLWDWMSWWVSRRLARHLLLKLQPAGSTGHRAMAVTWHTLADLIIAIMLLAAMAYLLAVGFAGYNQVAIALSEHGRAAFELERFIERAAAAPWSDGLWLTVMLISTLGPTFLHMIMLLASPIAVVALPTEKRLALAADLETYADQPERQASIRRRAGQYVAREKHGALALAAFLFVLLFGALGWLISTLQRGGFADLVLYVALCGIWTVDAIASVF